MQTSRVRVMCVDDNPLVTDALKVRLELAGFEWGGSRPDANDLTPAVAAQNPDIVLLDIDMPGRDPFEALEEMSKECPKTRTIIYTGHVRTDLLDRAFEAGAWGYVAKSAEVQTIVDAIRRVSDGDVVLDPTIAYIRADSPQHAAPARNGPNGDAQRKARPRAAASRPRGR